MLLSRKMKRTRMTLKEADAIIEKSKTEQPLELEKGDVKAIILAGVVVFVPFLMIVAGSLGFLYWFIFFVWGG